MATSVRKASTISVVMDMLYQEYCHRNPEQSRHNRKAIADALTGMHV